MINSTRITAFSAGATDAAGTTVRMIRAQPNWLVRLLAVIFVIVVVLPLTLLMIVVVLVAAVVIACLVGIRALVNRLRGLLPRHDGRSNVRVVRRTD
jgi:hypothetical protein